MKATEFVKKHGWDLAIRDIAALKGGFIKREDFLEHYGFDILDDLQNLVNAYELVESYGGLASAQKEAHKDCFEFNSPLLAACYLVASVDA